MPPSNAEAQCERGNMVVHVADGARHGSSTVGLIRRIERGSGGPAPGRER